MSGGEVEFLRLTGQPRAKRGSDEIPFLPDKRFQLLGYLAFDSGWVGRERAAFLFWPDSDTEGSRGNLRGLIQRLRTLPFDPGIEANKHQLRWNVPTDVQAFNQAVERGDLQQAIESYSGPLLQGLESDDAGEFGEWLEIAREELRSRWRAVALSRLAAAQPGAAGDVERGAESLVRRLLAEDPLDEEAVRTFLTTMGRLGQPVGARAVYQEFATRLDRELGLEPTSETVAAFEALRDLEPGVVASTRPPTGSSSVIASPVGQLGGAATSGAPTEVAQPASAAPREGVRRFGNLPRLSTRFVGREVELEEISARLSDGDCRLLSIVGQGGVGKTRLALAVAGRLAENAASGFDEGVLFVPLDVTRSSAEVVPVLADALGIGPVPGEDLMLQVLATLRDSRVLLVLDNFEHVLDAAEIVPRLLAAGEGIKVLVTTRERLGLDAEWTYPVEGLDYPGSMEPVAALDTYGAVRLLVDRARRVRPDFELTEADLPALSKLWEITQGLPLAIELAAAWLRAVPLTTLVDDLASNLDMLTSATRDSITRHGSIRGIFEQSWSSLSQAERQALSRLSVFGSPVSPEAATFVTGAARATIAALVDKSLLRLDRTGRYDRHPLLYSFTREKLQEVPGELESSEQRHSAYYLRFLRERTDRARGPEPAAVMREIAAEMREVRSAMRRARASGDHEQLVDFMHLLEMEIGYFLASGHTDETIELLEAAAAAASGVGRISAAYDLTARLGDVFGIHRGDQDRALVEYQAAAELARRAGAAGREAVFVSLCGVMLFGSDAEAGWAELDRALSLAREAGDATSLSTVLEHRAYVLAQAKEFARALTFYRESLDTVEGSLEAISVDPYDLARRRYYAKLNIGDMEYRLGRFDESLAERREALRIAQEMGNAIWQAHVHLELGEVLGGEGQHEEARGHLEVARTLYAGSHGSVQLAKVESLASKYGYELSKPVGAGA